MTIMSFVEYLIDQLPYIGILSFFAALFIVLLLVATKEQKEHEQEDHKL